MANETPLLDREALNQAFQYTPNVDNSTLPNTPFSTPSLYPSVNGEPTPSALSALENKILSVSRGTDDKLRGGSIPRSLAEVSSKRYPSYIPGDYDNEDAYAQGQGWPSKMVNGIGKGLSLTGTTLLQSTVGMVNGVVRAVQDGRAASFYDNDFNKQLDEFNKQLEDNLPNYYTNAEKDARWYSPKKLLTANFLWDGIVKNMGFSAGAYLSGGLYASGIKALSALPGAARLFSVGKAAETLAATEESLVAAEKGAETYGKIKNLSDKFLGKYNVLNTGQRITVAGLATTGEAGFEAFHNLNDFRDRKIQEYKDSHDGINPIGADLDNINEQADNIGNVSFLLNTALLTGTNYIQFPKILGSSYNAEKGMINSLSNEIGEIATDETGKFIKKEASSKAGRILSSIGKITPYTFSTSEGFEEGAQFAISKGVDDYYNKKYNNHNADWMESAITGISQTLGTDEGMENILIGGLSGSLMLAKSRYTEAKQKGANTALAIEAFNNTRLSDFTKSTIDSINRGTVLQEEREKAIRQGDILTSKDKEQDYLINYLTPRIKYGRYDLVRSDIDDYKRMALTDEGFAQLQSEGKALPTDTKEAYVQRLNNLENTANNMKSLYQSLMLRYGNLVDHQNKPVYSSDVMDKMVYSALKVADYDHRLPTLSAHLGLIGVSPESIIIEGKVDQKVLKESIDKINALKITSDKKDDLKTSLDDYLELSLRRDNFLKEYDDIKNSPQNYKELEEPVLKSGESPKKVTIKTKDGEEEISIGEEYFLGKTVEYDKSGKEVYRFPRITILGENEDGTIRVRDGKGQIKDISKSVLEDYKLGKVSDTLSNKKAKFYFDNINSIFQFNFGKGKKKTGRLEYSPKDKILNFVYKDGKGKIKRIEVTGDQFVPKQGYTHPQISKIGELTAADIKSTNDFASEQDVRIQEKRTSRLKILNDLFDEITSNHDKLKKLISSKRTELENVKSELVDLEDKIKNAKFTPKKGNFKAVSKRALQAAMRLSRLQEQLENEISILESDRDEAEFNASYVADLAQNIDLLPTDSKDFLQELKDQKDVLESVILETGKEINTISNLLDKVKSALDTAVDFLRSTISKFESKYPKVPLTIGQEWVDFLKANPNFLKLKPNYREDLKQVEDLVAQVEDLDIIPNERTLKELTDKFTELQATLSDTEKELKAKDLILSKFKEVADKYIEQKEQQEELKKNKQLQKDLLKTGDSGIQTREYDKEYEPVSKKTDVQVVTSTKVPNTSELPHHVRANKFGADLDSFPNREKIKGVVITSKNEASIGLPGLTAFLKGESDVDASKIVALVMVQNGKPVGADGKILTSPSTENAIFQVFPDPKLEWSKEYGGGTMFRKETSPEHIEFYKKQYSEWVEQQLVNPSTQEYPINASFGVPEYVTYTDDKGKVKRDYTSRVSVQDSGLIKSSDLKESPLILIPTTDTFVQQGSVIFNSPLGRAFLKLPNGLVKLDNRKLTKKEASAIYEAIHALSKDILKNGNAQSEESLRLIKWLKSIIYWGSPKNKTGFNSIFFRSEGDGLALFIPHVNKAYEFTPSTIEANKGDIVATLEGMYNNINSGLSDKPELWNEPYEEILSVSPDGKVETKEWDNYQTYLLANPSLPLATNIRPVKGENDTNRRGIYFTIADDADRYANPPKNKEIVKPAKKQEIAKESPKEYVLDGKTINTYVSPAGKKILFAATSKDDLKVVKGGDLDEVLKELSDKVGEEKAKENIKNVIKHSLPEVEEKKESKLFRKPAVIKVSKEDNDLMELQMDDLEEDVPLREKIKSEIQKFEKENWREAETWLKANFPNIPVYRVKNVIQAINGREAWGMLKDGAIYVYENAEVGTIYHEVFEGVWKMFTTPEEQSNILSEFRERKGVFTDRPTGKSVEYSKATDQQIKEQLAEEFRDYVIKSKPQSKSLISKLFKDIVDFIKSFFTGEKAQTNTNELFKRIGSGYYKQYTITSPLAYAKKGLIDIEQAFADNYSEFRIKDIPADIVNDIMQQMTYITLTDLTKNNKSIFNIPKLDKNALYTRLKENLQKTALKSRKEAEELIASKELTEKEAQPIIDKSIGLWKSITDQWEDLKDKHQEYLKTYSIEFDENDNIILNDEDASRKSDYQDATKIDIFKKANSAIKLLLSTLPRVNGENKLIESSINGVRLLPTSQVFMAIMNRVHNSRNIDEMIARIKEMSEEDNNYKTLYNRITKNKESLSQVGEVHDAQLITALWKTFKKQSPDVKNVYVFENGDVEVGDSNLSSAARQVSSEYINSIVNIVKKKNPYFVYSDKEKAFIGVPQSVKNIKLDGDYNRTQFLKSLGIEFSPKELLKLSSDKLETFREAVAGIKKSISEAKKIATVSRKVLDIKGRLMQLSLIRATLDNPEFDSTFFNVKGERVQSFIGTNAVSDLYDVLSQIENKKQLRGTNYEYLLTDVFSENSVVLDKIFNPDTGNKIKGSEQIFKPGYADGTINTENGKRKESSRQTYKERIIQELNLNSAGYYYNLVPGDASTEWMVYLGNSVSSDSLLSGYNKVNNIFKGYFLSELGLSRENRKVENSKSLRFFKEILGSELHDNIIKEKLSPEEVYSKYESKINKALQDFISNESEKLRNTLERYDILYTDEEGIKADGLSFIKGIVAENVLNRQLNALSINFMISNIELHKLLYSDPYQYSDELKRVKNANSPRQSIINNSPEFNKALNVVWNRGFKKGETGYSSFIRDYFKTVTLDDVISTSDLKDYGKFKETDGGGIISYPAYRLFRIKAGDWNDNEEKQYRHDVAYEKQQKGEELSPEEQELLKSNPDVKSAYTPIKPIVFGNKGTSSYNNIVLDKFALYPLSYRIIHSINPDSNALKLYNKMQKEDIDYGVFSSGRKVGSEGVNSLYNEDGTFNNSPFEALINIPHSIISVQTEVPSKDDGVVTRGSQITKLVTLDFMEAGVPIDFDIKGDINHRLESWNGLTEKEKLQRSPLYKEIKYNQSLLEQGIENGYKSLLNRMGIKEDNDGNFYIDDLTKVQNVLKDEILKREVNDNVISALNGFKEGDVILEATPAYQQIRNILYSIADKNVISPKISGGMKVQIPSTLLESVRAKKEKGAYTSNILKFYEDKDGQRVCEIMVGKWFQSDMSDEDLINQLNNTEEGKKILAGIAYRIPTQKQNSIDAFRIKQFLPREFGDSVVIPSALVQKVGSDFDIDKLSIYLKNTFVDFKGKLKLVPYKTKEEISQLYDEGNFLSKKAKDIIHKWLENRKIEDREDVVNNLAIAIFGEESYDQEAIDDYLDSKNDKDLKAKIVDRMYKQGIENEYIQSLENLVSHPLNFENLIKPNSADQLKGIAEDVNKKLGFEKIDYTNPGNMLKRGFMSRLRQAFVSGKYAIGIAAVNQTNHSLNQRQPIYIDLDKWDGLSKEDKSWLSGGTGLREDAKIRFKKYNTIEVGDKEVPTLSMIKNAEGQNISDIIGQFIDGYVDISKGPWIMELGAAPNVASTWLFLVKLGVPIKDVAYFMNQPIIKDYLRNVESAGYSWLFIDNFVKDMMEVYSPKSQVIASKTIPSTAELERMIGKQTKQLTDKQKDQQQLILSEFLKYSKMANHMFLITQGTNFDTATFNDPYLVFKKSKQLEKAQSSIISDVNSLIRNSFIDKLSSTIYNIRDAFSTILASDKSRVRDVIESTLTPYIDQSDRDFVKIARKAVNDLFDWAVQIDRKLNTQVENILLSDDNTAKEISDFVIKIKKDNEHPLFNNLVINSIAPHFSEKKHGGVNNIKIKNKENKVYDQNQIIYAFAELRDYLKAEDTSLYGNLVRLSVLQSGLSNSPISFTSLLPYEDFKTIYNKTLSSLETMPNLEDFNKLNIFQRNNWNDDDLVPRRKAKFSKTGKYNTNMKFYGDKRVEKAIDNKEIPLLVKVNTKARESNSDVIVYSWEVGTRAEKAEKRKIGDFSYIKRGLFKKIYKGNQPFEKSFFITKGGVEESGIVFGGEQTLITDHVYKAINTWGDSHSADGVYFGANEFYSEGIPSVIDNGFIKVDNEMSDEDILTYFEKPVKNKKSKEEDDSNSSIPECK